jgi:hypothetical protein
MFDSEKHMVYVVMAMVVLLFLYVMHDRNKMDTRISDVEDAIADLQRGAKTTEPIDWEDGMEEAGR